MKRLLLVGVVAAVMVLVFSGVAAAQTSPCVGGCDAEYIPFGLGYDPYEMWEQYGYPEVVSDPVTRTTTYWYWIPEEGRWYYFLPPTYGGDGNLYPYEG